MPLRRRKEAEAQVKLGERVRGRDEGDGADQRVRGRDEGDGAGRPAARPAPLTHLRGVAAAREVELAAALAAAHREAHALARAAPPPLGERRAAEHDAEHRRRRQRGAPAW